ncbi:9124_t:CDS:2, partial [Racocetra persica]
MIWILLDVSFEYEEKFDIDQERIQSFLESINHDSLPQFFNNHFSDVHDTSSRVSRVPVASLVKRKVVRIRVESRAKFLGRKI